MLLLDDELSDDEMAALYRACDVLVHPYRGEGFGMPVLEAMACGLPTIVTAGGPTDEFCPDDACWRIPSTRRHFDEARVDDWETVGVPWQLEPDVDALVELLRAAAGDERERAQRGAVAAEAARDYSWDSVAAAYESASKRWRAQTTANTLGGASVPRRSPLWRILRDLWRRRRRLSLRRPRRSSFEEDVDLRVLAAPAWRADDDRLAELLDAWASAAPAGTSACLYLLVGSDADGEPAELLQRTAAAARARRRRPRRGCGRDAAGAPGRPRPRSRAACCDGAYVELPGAAPGHARAARAQGIPVLTPSVRELRDVVGARQIATA